jgi:coenzyme F420 hydrogenase subunit beta
MAGMYNGFGKYRQIVSARATDRNISVAGQDGGVVTSLLCYALDKGIIDGAVLTRKSNKEWVTGQYVATTRNEIMESAGSIYALSPNIFQLKEAVRQKALGKVAYVGVPCQVDAVRKMQLYPFGARGVAERIALVIGIFCSENFSQESLRAIVEEYCKEPAEEVSGKKGDTRIKDVSRMFIEKGWFEIEAKNNASVPARTASRLAQDGDHVCPDLVAEYADISVGSIGSGPGWNTVFLRTKKGLELFKGASAGGMLETKDIGAENGHPGLKLLEKLSVAKKAMAKSNIEKRRSRGLFVTRDQYY